MRLQKSIAWREMQPQPDDKENAVGFQPGEANGHHITGKELALTQHLRQLRPHYRHCVRHFSLQPKSCLPTADEAGEILQGTENTVPLLQQRISINRYVLVAQRNISPSFHRVIVHALIIILPNPTHNWHTSRSRMKLEPPQKIERVIVEHQAQDAPTDAKFKEDEPADDQENEWEDDQEGERENDQEYELEAGQEYERKVKNVYIDVDDGI
ncbi:hypothetical protein BC938DRAFT_482577 [Jimgerdemannia flammicorona]|uniref:Uncharacterized protein n=1 Tax=Jimgerdemannia flammicorona TaxID=994334 RepID=A0A433QDT1_9FUNG|nr:hypothetical protein BC938DRAFT_482577 [Jimgerdemannia flammicorona]